MLKYRVAPSSIWEKSCWAGINFFSFQWANGLVVRHLSDLELIKILILILNFSIKILILKF